MMLHGCHGETYCFHSLIRFPGIHRTVVCVGEFRAADGGLLARNEILGFPISGKSSDVDTAEPGELILVVNQRPQEPSDAYDVESLIGHLAQSASVALGVASVEPNMLSREPAG